MSRGLFCINMAPTLARWFAVRNCRYATDGLSHQMILLHLATRSSRYPEWQLRIGPRGSIVVSRTAAIGATLSLAALSAKDLPHLKRGHSLIKIYPFDTTAAARGRMIC
jgi:hypothetical protein